MADRVLVGVAWPYANGHLHLGHIAGCYLPPDIFARYQRMAGREVLMVSGSDEHGTPITVRAEEEGVDPSEITDRYHEEFLQTFDDLGIGFVSPDAFTSDDFGFFTRTGTDNHREVVHDLFRTLDEEGVIYEDTQDALYCEDEDRYLPDRYVEGTCPHCGKDEARGDQCDACGKTLDAVELGDPVCKSCGATPVARTTTHLFFELSAFEDALSTWVEEGDPQVDGDLPKAEIFRKNVLDFTRNWLKEGLEDRTITRDIDWGVPVPRDGYEDKRIYVWFEAVIGYLSATVEWADQMAGETYQGRTVDAEDWKRFWQDPDCRVYNFLAKDNIPFHTIIWPAMIMGLRDGKGEHYNLPYDVPANEYLNMAGRKFSTSRGIGGTVGEFLEEYPADAVRYYLTRTMPEKRDADFRIEEFVQANNSELVAKIGNFIHRALSFADSHYDEVPAPADLDDSKLALEEEMFKLIDDAQRRCADRLEDCEFKAALSEIIILAQEANAYLNDAEPWKVAEYIDYTRKLEAASSESKVSQYRDMLDTIQKSYRNSAIDLSDDAETYFPTIIHTSLSLAKALTILMAPVMPRAADRAWAMLGQDGSVHDAAWTDATDPIDPGTPLGEPEPLFEKLEVPEEPDEADETEPATEERDMVTFQEFQKLDLRIGRIQSVEDHPDADKLYVLKVDIGGETRQLVAGLKPFLDKEALDGEQCVVVANLEPAELRGKKSEGMILAAEHDDEVVLLTPASEIAEGAKVK